MIFAILGKNWAKKVLAKLNVILSRQEQLMSVTDEVLATVGRLETAYNGLRADFEVLKNALANQVLSPEAVAALETITQKFEAFDSEQ